MTWRIEYSGRFLTREMINDLERAEEFSRPPAIPEPKREPLKFEAGQVVRFDGLHVPHVNELVVTGVDGLYVRVEGVAGVGSDKGPKIGLPLDPWSRQAHLLSPAPSAGDTWSSGESVARISAAGRTEDAGAQLLIVSDGEPFVGDVVAVARKLWEGGYRMVNAPKLEQFDQFPMRAPMLSLDDLPSGIFPINLPSHPAVEGTSRAEEAYERMRRGIQLRQARIDATTPQSALDGFVVPSKEALCDGLPCAGDMYEHTDGTIVEVREWRSGLRAHVLRAAVAFPVLIEADEPHVFAALLRQHGYTKHCGKWHVYETHEDRRSMELEKTEAIERSRAGAPLERVAAPTNDPDEAKRAADRIAEERRARLRRGIKLTQRRIDAATPQSPLDGIVVPSKEAIERSYTGAPSTVAFIEDAELPTLRPGMVVRSVGVTPLRKRSFGTVESVNAHGDAAVRWLGDMAPCGYSASQTLDRFWSNRWTIVTPDVRPLASLADAVAAIFAPADRATSRRYVDQAIACLRGEPFVEAIRAALVGVSERANLTPFEIAGCVAALRHWETRRPFDRDLAALGRRTGDRRRGGPWNRLQFECTEILRGALGYAPVWDYDMLWFFYERARSTP
jgi:hypothetical protein